MSSCLLTWVWDPRMCLTHHWETVTLWLQGLNMHSHGSFRFCLSTWALHHNTVLFNHFISYQHHTRLPPGHTCISSVNRSFTLHVWCKQQISDICMVLTFHVAKLSLYTSTLCNRILLKLGFRPCVKDNANALLECYMAAFVCSLYECVLLLNCGGEQE